MFMKGFFILLTLHGLAKAQFEEEDVIPRRTHYDTEPGNLPNDTDVSVIVVADEMWIQTQAMDPANVQETVTNSIQSAKSWYMEIVRFNFIMVKDDSITNITNFVDLGSKLIF